MAVSGNQLTRIGGAYAGVGIKLSIPNAPSGDTPVVLVERLMQILATNRIMSISQTNRILTILKKR